LNGGVGQYTGDDFNVFEMGFGAGAHLLFGANDLRFGFSRIGFEFLDTDISAKGFGVGPVVGVLIPLSSLSLEISTDLRYVQYGDWEADGETLGGSDSSGMAWGIKVGVAIPVGG